MKSDLSLVLSTATMLLLICLPSSVVSVDALIVIDYQHDFLYGGSLGAHNKFDQTTQEEEYLAEETRLTEAQTEVSDYIIDLIDKFEGKPIYYSKDAHPANHISFLSTHQQLKNNQSNQDIMDYLNQHTSIPGTLKVKITYDPKTVNQQDPKLNTYKVLNLEYVADPEMQVLKEQETNKVFQELWPDHCINNGNKGENGEPGLSYGMDLDESVQAKLNDVETAVFIPKGEVLTVDAYSIVLNNMKDSFNNIKDLLVADNVDRVFFVGVATDFCVMNSAIDLSRLGLGIEVNIVSDACIPIVPGRAQTIVHNEGAAVNFITYDEAVSKINGERRLLIV